MKLFYRFTRFFLKTYFHLFYHLKVYGVENIVSGKAIISSNHTSFLDPPLIATCCPEEIFFLARKSLFSTFVFGSLITNLNAFPVTGTAQDLGSMKLICKLLNDKKKVVIFPEGIRSFDGELMPFKTGIGMLALRCEAPIIPIYIHGCYQIWNRSQQIPKLWGNAACMIGPAIYPNEYAHLEKKEAHKAIADRLKVAIETLKLQLEMQK
jgi:1-acyl-sn-glycerol-3-phosphate acyltransferase